MFPSRFARLARVVRTALSLALVAGMSSNQAWAHAEHGHAQHGGVVAEAGVFQGEWVSPRAGGSLPQLILTDHGAPVPTRDAKGRLIIVAGGRSTEAVLTPAGDNRMQPATAVSIPAGSQLLVTVTLADGRKGALRFTLR